VNNSLKVENLSKLYRIGSAADLVSSDDSALMRLLKKPLTNFRKYRSLYTFTPDELAGTAQSKDLLWALKDISFEADPGQVLGLVGANGAGKSTLLKILSRITPPSSGRAIIKGRVSCLIEVGTGFHPELTGRENIYMSSTILGMRKSEVDQKLDEIIDFSGVEKFIDTPVKRYSSGMSVRLAFAVMAHLEPEILIVDEVLAVGDAEFQRKCLNKMGGAGSDGKTVLFVSHNMAAITRLCDRGLLLRNGQIAMDGTAADVVHEHVSAGISDAASRDWPDLATAPGDDTVRLRSIATVNPAGSQLQIINRSDAIGLKITYDVLEDGHVFSPFFTVVSDSGMDLFSTTDSDDAAHAVPRKQGRYVSIAWIPPNLLADGSYFVRVVMRAVKRQSRPFVERDVVAFTVVDDSKGEVVGSSWWEGRASGIINPRLEWTTEYLSQEMIIEG
jgi:lipopolysaccharide transport system ATP-binding protein